MRTLRQVISLLDEAFHLLRNAPMRAWAMYLIGSFSFLLALLYFVAGFERPNAAERLTTVAGVLAPLYLWFGFCRIQFAQELLLAAGDDRPARCFRALSNQLFLHAAELIVLPVSFLAVLPFGWSVAFFRIATCHPDPALGKLIKTSTRRASAAQRDSWCMVVLAIPLAIALFINLAIAAIFVPELLKSFSGYETEFTRYRGWIGNPAIWIAALGLASLLMESLLLASFALRTFYYRSETTGRDLLQNLKRVAGVLLIVGFCSCSVRVYASELTPSDLEQNISRVTHQSKYDWAKHPDDRPQRKTLSGFWQRIDDAYLSVTRAIRRGWQAIDKFIRDLMPKPSESNPLQAKAPPNRSLDWLVLALAALAVSAAGVVAAKALVSRNPVPSQTVSSVKAPVDLHNDRILASELPDEEWLALANTYTAEGQPRLAIRALYLSSLAWLAQQQLLTISPFKSNAEYQADLSRRVRSRSALELFADNRKRFESTWYGDQEAPAQLVEVFLHDLFRMKEQAHV